MWLKKARELGVDEALDQQWSGEASTNSWGMEEAYEVVVFRRSHHIYEFIL
jgi:hypothetical protein